MTCQALVPLRRETLWDPYWDDADVQRAVTWYLLPWYRKAWRWLADALMVRGRPW